MHGDSSPVWSQVVLLVAVTLLSVALAAYGLRLRRILLRKVSWISSARLVLIAPLLPWDHADAWLSEMNSGIIEFQAAGRPNLGHHVVLLLPPLVLLAPRIGAPGAAIR